MRNLRGCTRAARRGATYRLSPFSSFAARSRSSISSRFTLNCKYKSQEDRRESSPSLFSRRRDASLDGYAYVRARARVLARARE